MTVQYTKLRNINRGYMTLEVWQRSMEMLKLSASVLSKCERLDFKIKSQVLNSIQSISSNIAEGYGRRSIQEYLQFLYISLGSLAEALTRLLGLKEIGCLSAEDFSRMDALHYEIENKLIHLVKSLELKKAQKTWNATISENLLKEANADGWPDCSSNPIIQKSIYPDQGNKAAVRSRCAK